MPTAKRTRRRTSYRPVRHRSSKVSSARRAVRRRSKVFAIWKKRLLIVAALIVLSPILARAWVHISVADRVHSDIASVPECRVAMVLGAKVRPDGSLSASLASRVDKAIELYRAGKCEKLLMSGDNRFHNYNEPERMRDYAVARGVPARDIGLDYAGRRTFDSVYRARHIFGLKRMIVVTQSFHVDRAVFLCNHIGIDAYGVGASDVGDRRAQIREIPACLNALADVYLLHPRPVMGKKERL